VLTTPAVRKMAREHSIDLSKISGSGKQGRILKEDILSYLQQPAASQSVVINHITDRRESIKGVRKIMAERMAESMATIPHFTFVDEFDVTELIALRGNLADSYGRRGFKNHPDAAVY
jgi:2-oxoisovalerate dehydrogenase E2 component (dihydrolipoyl transacylase)